MHGANSTVRAISNWVGGCGMTATNVGDVMFVDFPKQPIVVLSSAEAVNDLLEKRSDIYSDRPHVVMDELFVILSLSMFLAC